VHCKAIFSTGPFFLLLAMQKLLAGKTGVAFTV
jgi:hypothetical protein